MIGAGASGGFRQDMSRIRFRTQDVIHQGRHVTFIQVRTGMIAELHQAQSRIMDPSAGLFRSKGQGGQGRGNQQQGQDKESQYTSDINCLFHFCAKCKTPSYHAACEPLFVGDAKAANVILRGYIERTGPDVNGIMIPDSA
jgi:hypothetical protein